MSVVVSVSALVPERDHIGELLLLADGVGGRDKICRFLQYFTKYLKWRAEVEKKSEDTIKMWNDINVSMGMVRKVLRFFRAIAVLRALRATWPSDISQLDFVTLMNCAAKFCLANYFFWDHFMYFNRVNVWKPSDPKLLEKASTLTEGSWLGEITFSGLEAVGRLVQLTGKDGDAAGKARAAAARQLVRCVLDFPVASHFMKLEPFGSAPHGWFGLMGTCSSAISLWEMWPTVLVAVPKKVA